MQYRKPALSLDDQLDQLVRRGLVVADRERALRYLARIGYYRLSPYMIPFQIQGGDHRFKPGTAFDSVLRHYVFDRQLRLLVTDALERFEVALRATLSNRMALSRSDPFWYLNRTAFNEQYDYARLIDETTSKMSDDRRRLLADLQRLGREIRDPVRNAAAAAAATKQSFLRHYLYKYSDPKLPPSWMMIEMLTFGDLMHMYRGLSDRRDKKAIAAELGITDQLLNSWLGTFQYARNVCAHHGRLWNREFGVSIMVPRSNSVAWLSDRAVFTEAGSYRQGRVYPLIVALQVVLKEISPGSTWGQRLFDLLEDFGDVPLNPMGFPLGWHLDPFWEPHIDPARNS